jgi:hypothetical protein
VPGASRVAIGRPCRSAARAGRLVKRGIRARSDGSRGGPEAVLIRQLSAAKLAEREGFEPSVEFPLHTLSKRAPSTTRTSLRSSGINSLAEGGEPCKNPSRDCDAMFVENRQDSGKLRSGCAISIDARQPCQRRVERGGLGASGGRAGDASGSITEFTMLRVDRGPCTAFFRSGVVSSGGVTVVLR